MTTETSARPFWPLNIHAVPGSAVIRARRAMAKIPRALAPGIKPTKAHDLIYHGGKIIPDLTFTSFYMGGQAAWAAQDIQNIDRALAAALSDPNLNNVMVQYFPQAAITTTFKPSSVLPGPAPATVSKGDIEALARTLHDSGTLKSYDLSSTVFAFMLPSGTVLTDDSNPSSAAFRENDAADSLNGLGGYHGSIHLANASNGSDTVYYAVGVYSEQRADGSTNGIPVFDAPWKNVAATFYHELNEARTDPDVEDAIRAGNDPSAINFLGWMSNQGEECGDFPVFEANPLTSVFQEVELTDGSGTVPVQFQYSDAVHGPEGPISVPANKAPTP